MEDSQLPPSQASVVVRAAPTEGAKVEEPEEVIENENFRRITNEFKWSETIPEVGKKGTLFKNRSFVANVDNGKTIKFVGDFSYENGRVWLFMKVTEGSEMLLSEKVLKKFHHTSQRFDANLSYYLEEYEQKPPSQRSKYIDSPRFSTKRNEDFLRGQHIDEYNNYNYYNSGNFKNFKAVFANSAGDRSGKRVTYIVKICMKVREAILNPLDKNHQKMAEILQGNKELSDIKIICNGKTFDCHKQVLGCRSEVFAAMFSDQSDMVESKSGEVEINDVGHEAVESMIQFMYHDKILPNSINQDLLLLADKYMIHDLMDFCINNLVENLAVENVFEVLQMAHLIDKKNLFQTAVKFLFENKEQMKDLDSKFTSTKDVLSDFFENDKLLAEKILKTLFNLEN